VSAEPAVPARDPDAEYFQAIEEFFVSRRGDPLFLSNADWLLIRRWRQAGLPLRVVQRGIGDALDSHALSWARGRKVVSLKYCAAEVEAAAERWRRALSGGQEAQPLAEALIAVATAMRAANLGPHARPVAEALAASLVERAADPHAGETLERWLREREQELLDAVDRDLPEERRRALDEEVERDLAAYGDRLPAAVLAQIKNESRARRRLEAHGLPRLSLWTL